MPKENVQHAFGRGVSIRGAAHTIEVRTGADVPK